MYEWVGQTWHLKIFYCHNSLGTSWDAKNILKKFSYFALFLRYSCLFTFLAEFENGRQRSKKGHQSSFLKFPITKKIFSPPQFLIVKIEGVWKCIMIFLFTFVTFSKQIAGLEKKFYSMEWPANKDKHVDRPNITVSWTGTKLGPQTCFVNKQLTDVNKKLSSFGFLTWFWTG